MRTLLFIVNHVALGTLVAMALGMGYLWHTRVLTNEKVFRMLAIVHDVDIDTIAKDEEARHEETPPEEPSLDEQERLQQVKLRNYEIKLSVLKQGRQEFDHSFQQLSAATARFDQIATELEGRLQQEGELSTKENLNAVVNWLESLKPQIAKEQLLMYLDYPEGEKDVITLLKSMQEGKRKKILQQFRTPEDLKQLHKINSLMLNGYPDKVEIDGMLEQIRNLEEAP